MKVMLIGANGQLGSDLKRVFGDDDLVARTHADLEICNHDAVRRQVAELGPDVVINTAAFHRVDDCEDQVEKSFQVNAYAVRNLAQACDQVGAKLVHLSTDYVFGGDQQTPYSEDDRPHPLNVYGVSKLAGEYFVRTAGPRHFVVRTTGLYGVAGSSGKGGNFVELMLRLAREGKPIKVVHDQVLTPTYTLDLAQKIKELARSEAYGLYHVTSSGGCSWYEFARTIFELAGLKPDLSPTTTNTFGARSRRPAYSVLDHVHLRQAGFTDMRPWPEALAAYLKEKGHTAAKPQAA